MRISSRSLISYFFVSFLGFSSLLATPLAFSSDWKSLTKGLTYRHEPYRDYSFDLFRLDLTRLNFSPVVPEVPTNVQRLVEDSQALLAINANFFDPYKKPLGLVIRNHHLLNSIRPISWWGVFFIEARRAFIVSQKQFTYRDSIAAAIQSGPRLIEKGLPITGLKPNVSPKSFLCLENETNVVIGISQDFVSVDDLVVFLKDVVKCRDALNLDGGSSSQLYAKIGSFELNLPSPVTIPVGLGVFKIK